MERGPSRFVRHPIYDGSHLLMGLGTAIAIGSLARFRGPTVFLRWLLGKSEAGRRFSFEALSRGIPCLQSSGEVACALCVFPPLSASFSVTGQEGVGQERACGSILPHACSWPTPSCPSRRNLQITQSLKHKGHKRLHPSFVGRVFLWKVPQKKIFFLLHFYPKANEEKQ